ncbi:MAG: hypothetical protein GY826_05020 [Fuerstiella sp.]|nr:hypothetical protein [Fuerstiella sp.]
MVIIHITAYHERPLAYADELRAIVRAQMGNNERTVNMATLHWLRCSDKEEE